MINDLGTTVRVQEASPGNTPDGNPARASLLTARGSAGRSVRQGLPTARTWVTRGLVITHEFRRVANCSAWGRCTGPTWLVAGVPVLVITAGGPRPRDSDEGRGRVVA